MVITNRIALILTTLALFNMYLQVTSKEVRRLRRSGPNLCGGRLNPYCCSGWQPSSQDSSLCLAPVCTSNCGIGGACIKPNLCQCSDGQLASTCQPNTDGCTIRCLNGAMCKDNKCLCLQGYTGQYCENAICEKPCYNGGRCIKPDICACSLGFGGPQCQTDYRPGPCYKEIKDLACKGQVSTLICTKDLCCATIGKAWGSPCEKCPINPKPCRKGYIPNYETRDCLDIDECEAIPDVCGVNGKCTNTIGSYSCQRCRPGFKYVDATKRCEDIDECSDDRTNQCLNGRCRNTIGSYQCVCDRGYVLSSDGTSCIWPDVVPTAFPGKVTHGCYGQILGGVCMRLLSSRNTSKEDCCCGLVAAAGWSNTCQLCPTPNTLEYTQLCSSVAICKADGDACVNGICTRTASGFECVCNTGFVASTTGRCVDIDECASDHGCVNSYCRNTVGSFVCICQDNFRKAENPLVCVPISGIPGSRNLCDENPNLCQNGRCLKRGNDYECECASGFELSRDKKQCLVPQDKCADNPNLCQNGRCVKKGNDYECECASGFELSRDKKRCLDVNECLDSQTCRNGQCSNIVGSWRCTCNMGFKLSRDEKVCRDINECQTISGVCANGVCINNDGDYRCKCITGYTLSTDRHMCLDTMLSRCYASFTNNVCGDMVFRSLTLSQCCCGMDNIIARPRAWGTPCEPCPYPKTDKHNKLCIHGAGKDSGGKDINECANNIGAGIVLCPNGQCRNTKGDYFCVCNAGYRATEDGKKCEEVNECLENTDLCRGGNCVDTPGSYKCICPKGYFFDLTTKACEDEDECKDRNSCIDGTCLNNVGSYRCQCPPGMTLHESGRLCEDKRQGKCWRKITNNVCEDNVNGGMTKELCCQTLGKAWGSPCTKCPLTGQKCKPGFAYKNFTCVDIDECSSFDDLCQNGRCINTLGSYECRCSPGLTLDETKSICKDERKAVCYQTIFPDRCTNPVPGLHKKDICCCFVGGGWGEPCEECPIRNTKEFDELCRNDILGPKKRLDECRQFPGICSNGDCIDTADGFKCNCRSGFALDETGRNCTDINECGLTPGLCGNGTCVNIPGGFRCNCYNGFKNAPMMMEICIDVNECEDLTNPCQGGTCINTIGSFKCQCPEGKRMDPSGLMCQDINECAENTRICRNGICQNFVGGYQCSCYRGFKPSDDMKDCIDRDECSVNNGGCQSLCVNTPGSYKCDCPTGLRLTIDRKTCEDVNECTETPEICGVGNKCRNVIGGHICSCNEGFTISEDRKSCIDINECVNDSTLCSNGKCVNLIGFYRCECNTGYKWDEIVSKCVDVDECNPEVGVAYCDSNSECVNTVGSYTCNCKLGYEFIDDNCVDVDECLPRYENCATNEKCVNTLGSYNCDCVEGYRFDGTTCKDVDECREGDSYCENGACMNLPGSYKCECNVGYMESEDDKSCDDFDECSVFKNVCHHGRCVNIPGSFQCQCDKGFQLNKNQDNCTDMNECTKTGMCINGRCINEMGRYRCECDQDFEPNPTATACIDTRLGPCHLKKGSGPNSCENLVADNVLKTYCCCSVGATWNDPCEACPSNDTAEFKHLCPTGYGFVTDTTSTSSLDIDECLFPNICINGTCVNNYGSYECICKNGFRYSKMYGRCEDIDECADNAYICGLTGVCFNLYGSYRCECPPGEERHGSFCVDYRAHECYRDDFSDSDTEGSSPETNCDMAKSVGRMTRTECCCSLGVAYGPPDTCKICPKKETDEFKSLCGGGGHKVPGGPGGGGGKDGNITKEDINECTLFNNPCVMGKCINTKGSYTCECDEGFATQGGEEKCKDRDECLTRPCINGECKNTHGSFMCICKDGYATDETGIKCVDMNECHLNTTCTNGKCINLVGDYRCTCNPGFRLVPNNKACEDIDECSTTSNLCPDGNCVNTPGSYKCQCNEGFREDARHRCQDIDECVEQRSQICRNSRFCVNTVGGFTCECLVGYKLDDNKRHCRDQDECTEIKDFCLGGTCTNTIGGSRCECSNGFRLHHSSDRCVDINECDEDPNLCQMGGQCINSLGSFSCSCPEGYEVANSGKMCVDKRRDYCFEMWDSQGCSQIKMENVTKSLCCCVKGAAWGEICELCPSEQTEEFSLLCPGGTGFVAMKNKIEDVNECDVIPNLCKNGRCINSDGSYRCQCFDGYVLDSTGRNCKDKDECLITPGICGNGTCTNIPGSYSCLCADGFQNGLKSPACQDINECAYDRSLCAFRCVNIPGSYQCICPRGYILHSDGKHCTDLNECEARVHDCAHICKNFVGGYKCVCPSGHRRVGSRQCIDIDECRERVGLCLHGSCRNTPGDYICDCNNGYKRSQDGRSCEDLSVGYCFSQVRNGICKASPQMMVMITRASCCCSDGIAWGDDCTLCPQRGSNNFRRLCTGERRVVNECRSIPGLCPNGKCIDTYDSYRCMCNPGYQLSSDGKRCIDMDECAQIPKPCPYKCTNQPGTYLCECPEGFQQSIEDRGCEDIDECANNTHNCPKACINTIGSYTCDCGKGYVTKGSMCLDEDECRKYPNICGYGRCLNQQGSYTCVCNRGFKYDAQKKKCVDMNECDVRTCQGTCLNTNGGYRCGCGPGFVRQIYWNQCVDIDECRTGANKCGQTQCLNIRGGYRCTCAQGYQLDRRTMSCTDTNECQRNPCAKSNCYNIGGGFQCTCPQGFVAIGGGHCISKYGQRCYDCAKQTRPLVPKKITSEHKYKFGENPEVKKPKVTPALYSSSQKISTYTSGSSHNGYTPYKPKPKPDPYRYTYTYTGSSSSGGRKRRMSHIINRLKLIVPHNVTTHDKLLILTPVLQNIQKQFQYEIVKGNKLLFGIKVHKGMTILHCKKSLKDQQGTRYKLLLKGRLNHVKVEKDSVLLGEEEIEFMAEKKGKVTIRNKKKKSSFGEQEAKKFNLEVYIKIV